MRFKRKKSGKCSFFTLGLEKAFCSFSTRSCGDLANFASALDIDPSEIVQAEQVHKSAVALVTAKEKGKTIKGVDALMTKDENVPLSVRTADCIPIFILDKATPAIALIHGGWRGAVKGIAQKTLKAMRNAFDTRIKNCIIAVGPSIGPCCYEVGWEVINPLSRAFKGWGKAARSKKDGKWMLDLALLNELALLKAGASRKNIIGLRSCTCCKKLFHSFRRDGTEHRNYTLAMLR